MSEKEQDATPRWKMWVTPFIFAAGLMFVIDMWMRVTPADAFHQGPLGMVWIWTPGSTAMYLVLALALIDFIRQGPVEARR